MRFYNVMLNKHTTFRIGGPVDVLSIPADENEFLEEIKYCIKNNYPYKILGNGSNILVTDKGVKGFVIKNTSACSYTNLNENIVSVGSSLPLKDLVNFCVDNNLGGLEFLYSIPGTVGGAVYMNAGRGESYKMSISDKIISVRIFDGNQIKVLNKYECCFNYRSSIFSYHKNWVILSANFKLDYQPKAIGEKKIRERIEYVNKTQNRRYPNAGSIFKRKSCYGLRILRGLRIGNAQIDDNWIYNLGNAKAKDVLFLIRLAQISQILTFVKPKLEIEIW